MREDFQVSEVREDLLCAALVTNNLQEMRTGWRLGGFAFWERVARSRNKPGG